MSPTRSTRAPASMDELEDLLSGTGAGAGLALLKRSRVLTRLAWKALRVWQDLSGNAPNELAQLERMEPAPPPGSAHRVLIFSLRGWTTHLAWESTIARALHLRNAATLTVVCDKVLPACEPRTVGNDFASTCDRCQDESRRFLSRARLPFRWLGEFLETGDVEGAHAAVSGLGLAELRALGDGGVPIGRLVAASVNRHLLQGGGDPTPEFVAAYGRFVAAGIVVRRAGARLLESFRPDTVLVLNGLFYAEAILSDLARREGVTVWAYERGKRRDSLIFALNEPVIRQTFDEKWAVRRSRSLNSQQAAALESYVAARFAGEVGIERLWPTQTTAALTDAPTAVLFTNVPWDTAMFDSDLTFASMTEWVLHTIDLFRERPDRRLVIRIHPAETRVPFKRSLDPVTSRIAESGIAVPDNVRILSPDDTTSSYDLLGHSQAVLVYASTIGLEAALEGIPTVVAGRTHYRGRGFTSDPADPESYDAAVERAFTEGPLDEERRELARRYAYLYFFEEIIPFPLVHEQPRSYVTFAYERNDQLAPGMDPGLDAICDALLHGAPLANPGAS